jgi:hypothetical protein
MPLPVRNGENSSSGFDDKKNGEEQNTAPVLRATDDNDNHRPQPVPLLGDQMDHILQLLNRRVRGEATNEQIESAVDQVLNSMNIARPTAASPKPPPCDEPFIQPDMENYDNEDDQDENNGADSKPAAVDTEVASSYPDTTEKNKEDDTKKVTLEDQHVDNEKKRKAETDSSFETPKPKRRGGRKRIHPLPTTEELAYKDTLEQIPMGAQAAKMMTTFGDGPTPIPEALEAALLGTRKTLQVAIMDARKVRRRLQHEFLDAQSSVDPKLQKAVQDKKRRASRLESLTKQKAKKETSDPEDNNGEGDKMKPAQNLKSESQTNSLAVDPRLVFRALQEGTDKLSFQHKCGFHIEELEHLFPEEMKAYHRWIDMHEQYNESKSDGKEKLTEKVAEEDDENEDMDAEGSPRNDDEKDIVEDLPEGGYMKERLGVFDFRTDRMKKDWYMEFAKIRAGSFLPNTMRVRKTQTEKDWDTIRKKKGKHFAGTWETISGRSVRFLHWLGFDPPNLHPPDEETTQALAFLAYDRLGRIVEKAIYLRNLVAMQKKKQEIDNDTANSEEKVDDLGERLWELPQGEQLTKEDIERAMEDPGIKPATVYGSEDVSGHSSIQLYFGPGWEDRLELEMEEFLAATQGSTEESQVSAKEREFREQEAEILKKIAAPPTRGEDALKKLVADRKGKKK